MAMRKGLPAKLAATDADDTRYDFSGLIVCNADGTPRGGVLSPVGSNLVTATGTMNVSVVRFQGAAVRDGGVVLLANDGPANVLLDAAPAANSRIDVVWAKQNDASSTVSVPDADNLPVFGVSKGTAGAVPVKPSVPDGALELATVEIPSTATATNSSGVVITQSAQFTAAAGGVVPFRTVSAMEAWTTAAAGTSARVLADSGDYVRSAGAWVRPSAQIACALGKSANQNLTTSYTALIWDVEISDPAGIHSNTVNPTRLTAPVAGLYEVSVKVYNSNTSGMGTVRALLNGTSQIPGSLDRREASGSLGAGLSLQTTFSLSLAVGDYVEVFVLHSTASGNIIGALGSDQSANLLIKLIGP